MKIIKRIIILLLIVGIVVVSSITIMGYQEFKRVIEETPISEKVASIESKKSYTKFEDISKIFLDAIVAIEDHRFYEHSAIDLISIGRAMFVNVKEQDFVQGGSTITQQLAKNIYFTQDVSVIRKVAEIFMAIELEKNYSKEKLLELYVNTNYYGNGYYSIKEASKGYFSKEPNELSTYEATLLAGVPNAPSIYAPTNNLKLAEQRQKYVISAMLEYGKLTKEQADEALRKQQTN